MSQGRPDLPSGWLDMQPLDRMKHIQELQQQIDRHRKAIRENSEHNRKKSQLLWECLRNLGI